MNPEAVLSELNDAVARLEQFPAWLNDQIQQVVRRVNALLEAVPFWAEALIDEIVEQARQLLQRIAALAQRLVSWLQEEVFPGMRGPFTIYSVGTDWTTSVYSTVTDVAGQVQVSETRVDEFWTGPAATAYAQEIPAQRAAADKVAEIVSKLRETLHGLALSLGAAYIAIAAALVVATVEIAGGAAAVASILGIPPGLVAIVVGLATAIGGTAGAYAAGKELVSGTMSHLAELLEARYDGRAFENGAWPTATSGIGNPRDWAPAS
ncbi:MAG TPA: hypothetical protein VKY81_07640 [Natronosporangium sp.]|nr:hypothetical protein [Natronosporangium sp.]